ncbi:GNAT family N-acetyltransferase [Aquimarina agarilytica]|uniref:GNAT family N-acetyltransferase n=1 Tax=Aquimarina agarilytica TaxID=1087449 RepID=UPI0002D80002|nr:GNAT family protein [Aquimarina agarilytica]
MLKKLDIDGSLLRLEVVSLEHQQELTDAVKDGNLWELWYTSVPKPENMEDYIKKAIQEYKDGVSLTFVVRHQLNHKIVGSTRYMNIELSHKRLEIGTTWYAKSYQRTGVNTECKYLLLTHAFEQLDCIAVEFRTHIHNLASRKAIENLGAKQDGILRNHKIDATGCLRDTVVFSIINAEWPTVKKSLEFKMKKKYQ